MVLCPNRSGGAGEGGNSSSRCHLTLPGIKPIGFSLPSHSFPDIYPLGFQEK